MFGMQALAAERIRRCSRATVALAKFPRRNVARYVMRNVVFLERVLG